ncbi:MAG: hypothetical protein K2X93_18815 [Candidatus Obscuribacterales bacterium]|nr:hypothetical protein [Candidatus Obscuribacterales bacterium]
MTEAETQNQESEISTTDAVGSGFRLQRLELYNWGTFHGQVWSLHLNGRNCLMTGDIGSGKSTVVDAVTTLLMPHSRVAYNKAAGADSKERNLLSYVLGHYKSERHELTGTAKAVALRDQNSYSVILGVFRNEGFDQTVTLAQVFWMKDIQGTPARLFVCAEREMSISSDLANFGTDISGLKKKLRTAEIEHFDTFPPYGAWFRRRFGISGEQAMELFHQTVSLKSVGNLTEFVRTHMLEPFDVESRLKALINHFDDLNRSHEAVLKAARQVDLLTPLVDDCRKLSEVTSACEVLRKCREALKVYFAEIKRDLLKTRLEKLEADLTKQTATVARLKSRLDDLRLNESALRQSILDNGGDRIERLADEIKRLEGEHSRRKDKFGRYSKYVEVLEISPATNQTEFDANQKRFEEIAQNSNQREALLQNEQTETSAAMLQKRKEHDEISHEIESLKSRRSNIPRRQIELRASLCDALDLKESDIPFAGELIQVREDQKDWEGAAERVLHNFALSLLVPDEHYVAVNDWVDGTHLKGKLVYFRVRDNSQQNSQNLHPDSLAKKLSIKPDSVFYDWLEGEVARRFDFACCNTREQFRRELRAITQAGQMKSRDNRHEKDDTFRIDDRSRYVLGWSNENKINILKSKSTVIESEVHRLVDGITAIKTALDAVRKQLDALAKLEECPEFQEIDWHSIAIEIAKLQEDKKHLEATSDVLKHLTTQLQKIQQTIIEAETKYSDGRDERVKLEERKSTAVSSIEDIDEQLASPDSATHFDMFNTMDTMRADALDNRDVTVESCQNREQDYRFYLQSQIDNLDKKISRLRENITRAMKDFNNTYSQDTQEIDASVESGPEYERMLKTLLEDDLPRFQARFKELLNENTIREVAQFQSQLARERELIKERIEKINESLTKIDYNEGRYIVLEPQATQDAEIREFQSDLRSCTEGSFTGSEDDQYSESKFIQVKSLIERFRGRQGQVEQDERWTKRVTDVRNWFFFGASERYREDDSEFEHYSDSGGKSGGQKEKLAYTILAASLAYQFGLEWGERRSRSFRFVVIDEAFGRGSDESAKFGLTLFKQLELQLLVVTPMQKVKVIEPFVNSVGFVHNDGGRASKIRNMTIEEYHREKSRLLRNELD